MVTFQIGAKRNTVGRARLGPHITTLRTTKGLHEKHLTFPVVKWYLTGPRPFKVPPPPYSAVLWARSNHSGPWSKKNHIQTIASGVRKKPGLSVDSSE